MKARIISTALMLLSIASFNQVVAQSYVTLQSQGVTSHYDGANSFVEAYNASQSGDTIYLPGGMFTAPVEFEKSLTIYGVGFCPDSTRATEKTAISNGISLHPGVSTFYLEGVEIMSNLYTGDSRATIDKVELVRCKINSTLQNYSGTVDQLFIRNCLLVGSVSLGGVSNPHINNSIFAHSVTVVNAQIKNCLFLREYPTSTSGTSGCLSASSCTVKNNIFLSPRYPIGTRSTNNTFEDNIFVVDTYLGSTPIDNGNYANVPHADIFVNQTGYAFDFTHDYHLKVPETYVDSKGEQIGIYGGKFPWKEGAVPCTPHIRSNNTPDETDEDGNLQLNIVVSAQGEID